MSRANNAMSDTINEAEYISANHESGESGESNDEQEVQPQTSPLDYDTIDEALIPVNSSIDGYNQNFYEIYNKIRMERGKIPDLIKSLDDYIIIPTKINFDKDLEITVKCLRALSFASTKYWGTNQNLARLILIDIFFSDAFFWDSVYDDTWNEELQSFGI